MATITPKNGDLTAGVAGQSSDTINPSPDPLITGDAPALFTEPLGVAADTVLEARTVVGLDSNGNIIQAVEDAGTPANNVQAIGFVMYAIDTTGEADGAVEVEVVRGGVFNPDLLVWEAGFNTDALKRGAFRGAPSPTSIIIRKPTTMTVA
tara:strand:- start:18132 stop:18584 length:453 start_codon:yes stop_codon:yes gene_type:complete